MAGEDARGIYLEGKPNSQPRIAPSGGSTSAEQFQQEAQQRVEEMRAQISKDGTCDVGSELQRYKDMLDEIPPERRSSRPNFLEHQQNLRDLFGSLGLNSLMADYFAPEAVAKRPPLEPLPPIT